MKKYDMNLVDNYIANSDLGDYDIDELENDPEFMFLAILKSKDKKLFDSHCKNFKNDHTFIIKIIYAFRDDKEFTYRVANEYLNNNDVKDVKSAEVAITMVNIYNNSKSINDYDMVRYYTIASNFFKNVAFDNSDELMDNLDFQDCFDLEKTKGVGFVYSLKDYENNPIALDYIARNYINEFFDKSNSEFFLDDKSFDKYTDIFGEFSDIRFREYINDEFKKYYNSFGKNANFDEIVSKFYSENNLFHIALGYIYSIDPYLYKYILFNGEKFRNLCDDVYDVLFHSVDINKKYNDINKNLNNMRETIEYFFERQEYMTSDDIEFDLNYIDNLFSLNMTEDNFGSAIDDFFESDEYYNNETRCEFTRSDIFYFLCKNFDLDYMLNLNIYGSSNSKKIDEFFEDSYSLDWDKIEFLEAVEKKFRNLSILNGIKFGENVKSLVRRRLYKDNNDVIN